MKLLVIGSGMMGSAAAYDMAHQSDVVSITLRRLPSKHAAILPTLGETTPSCGRNSRSPAKRKSAEWQLPPTAASRQAWLPSWVENW